MVSKNLLFGLGLIGASIFVVPALIGGGGGKTKTYSGGGGGGTPSVAMVGLPSGAGGIEGTKKDAVTNVYNIEAPIIPADNLLSPDAVPTTKKESSTVPADAPIGKTYYSDETELFGITKVSETTAPKKVRATITPPITTAITHGIKTEPVSAGSKTLFNVITSPKYIVKWIGGLFNR